MLASALSASYSAIAAFVAAPAANPAPEPAVDSTNGVLELQRQSTLALEALVNIGRDIHHDLRHLVDYTCDDSGASAETLKPLGTDSADDYDDSEYSHYSEWDHEEISE